MSGIKLNASQYSSFDSNGETLATRAVRVWPLDSESEEGPGLCFGLRTGFEDELGGPIYGDGIGVSLTITDEQLAELGYLTKAQVEAAMRSHFPAFDTNRTSSASSRRMVLNSLQHSLSMGVDLYAPPPPIEEDLYEKAMDILSKKGSLERRLAANHRDGTCLPPRCVYSDIINRAIEEARG